MIRTLCAVVPHPGLPARPSLVQFPVDVLNIDPVSPGPQVCTPPSTCFNLKQCLPVSLSVSLELFIFAFNCPNVLLCVCVNWPKGTRGTESVNGPLCPLQAHCVPRD